MTDPLEQRNPQEKAKALHQLAVEIVIRLNIVLKSARLYEPNNILFQRQISFLLGLIKKALTEEGEASFTIRESTLFFNNLRLKYGYANYHFFKFLLQELRKKEIGGIDFDPEVTEDHLKLFISLLAKGNGPAAMPFESLVEETKNLRLHGISLQKMLLSELEPKREKQTARVFFLGITHLEEAFAGEDREEKIKLSTTRRLIQSVFNHLTENESFIQGLTNIKNFHEYTLNHSMNVCVLSIALGRRLGLDRNELIDLGISAFFHDLGKLDTPKEILEKPSRLDAQEREIIEKHPHQGAGKLVQFREFKNLPLRAIHVALEHHVKEDLTGYPRYYKKQSINLYSKIVKIADYFDAITTKRVYRTTEFTRDEALAQMLGLSGKEFHPLLLREFVKMMGIYPVGSLVALNTGELALIVENNTETALLLRPKVKLISDPLGNKKDGEIVDLSEVDPQTNTFSRMIVKSLNPEKYGVRVSDYFLAQAN